MAIINMSPSSLAWFLEKNYCSNAECHSEASVVKGVVPRMMLLLGGAAFKRWGLPGVGGTRL